MLKTKKGKEAEPAPAALALPTTADECQAVVADIDGRIDLAKRELAALENARESVVLSGGDVSAHSRLIVEVGETVRTLQAGRAAAVERLKEAQRAERRAAFEQETVALHGRVVPDLTAVRRRRYELLYELIESGKTQERLEQELHDRNTRCRQQDRPDLVKPVSAALAEASAAVALPHSARLADAPRRARDESDEAWTLRLGNWRANRATEAHNREPLRLAATQAKASIEKYDIATERERQFRPIGRPTERGYIQHDALLSLAVPSWGDDEEALIGERGGSFER